MTYNGASLHDVLHATKYIKKYVLYCKKIYRYKINPHDQHCKWIYMYKITPHDGQPNYKANLVAKGFKKE